MLREEREPAHQPSARGLAYWRATDALAFASLWGVVTIASAVGLRLAAMLDEPKSVVLLLTVAIGVLSLLLAWFVGILPRLAIRYSRYELTDDAAYIQRGFLTRRRAVVPYARIQSVLTRRGPVQRRFGLATVVLQTAASSERISMLDDEVADELRDRISAFARRSHDDI